MGFGDREGKPQTQEPNGCLVQTKLGVLLSPSLAALSLLLHSLLPGFPPAIIAHGIA